MRSTLLVGALGVALLALSACNKDTGSGQKTAGQIESGVGSITGDQQMKREGKKDEVVGGVKSSVHDLKTAVKDATH